MIENFFRKRFPAHHFRFSRFFVTLFWSGVFFISVSGTGPSARLVQAQEDGGQQGLKNGKRPNIVYIMSDELAYFEVGYNGAKQLQTPRIDRMAREGMIFTNALAAAPVCAPLRACLMTGKHMGHCSVRANDGGTPLRRNEPTIASMLSSMGYATGGLC